MISWPLSRHFKQNKNVMLSLEIPPVFLVICSVLDDIKGNQFLAIFFMKICHFAKSSTLSG